MASNKPKTVRFSQVVERFGEPQVHTLWLPPDKDPELQRAEKAHRVMTVESSGAGKSDVGAVGFDRKAGHLAQFLIFPKSLRSVAGARVVGIKFDLVAQPKLSKARPRESGRRATAPPTPPKPDRPSPVLSADQASPRKSRDDSARKVKAPDGNVVPFTLAKSARQRGPKMKSRPVTHASPSDNSLIREVRAALKELERGETVPAYQRLQRAASTFDGRGE